MTDYMGRPVVVNAPSSVPGIVAPPLPASAIIFPVAGRDGTSISIGGTVATYAELPSLAASDKGTLYVVQADGLGYVWSGTAWPADGDGIEIRGPQGDRGLGIESIAVVGDSLRMTMSDGSVESVTVPALVAAAQSALAAAGSASAASGSAAAAGVSATAASTDAARAEAAAESAEIGAPVGGWTIPTLADDVHQMLPLSVGVDDDGNFGATGEGRTPLPSFLAAMQTVFGAVAGAMVPFVEDALAELVGAAPETLDTLAEIAEALGGDPNLAANLTAAIGLRAKTVDVDAALAQKAAIGHTHTAASIGAVTAPASGLTIWRGTNTAYTAIGTKDPNTLYLRLP